MQTLPTTPISYPDCYLQIRRGKQTIFIDLADTATVHELKRILAQILEVDHTTIRLFAKGHMLDADNKRLIEYGITTKQARPQNPFQLEFILKLDDGTFERVDVTPYAMQNDSSNDE